MNRLYRWALPLLLTPVLGGCFDSQLLQRDPTVDQFYTLDSEKLRLCRGLSNKCYDLNLIAFNQQELPKIERAYSADIRGPNYPLSLGKVLMNPPGETYTASPVDSNGRYLRLPINSQTDTVWRALEAGFKTVYEQPSD